MRYSSAITKLRVCIDIKKRLLNVNIFISLLGESLILNNFKLNVFGIVNVRTSYNLENAIFNCAVQKIESNFTF